MNVQKISYKEQIIQDYIKKMNVYNMPNMQINFDMRGYAKYIEDNKITDEATQRKVMEHFVLD